MRQPSETFPKKTWRQKCFEQMYLEEKTSLCTYNAESVGKLGITIKRKGRHGDVLHCKISYQGTCSHVHVNTVSDPHYG